MVNISIDGEVVTATFLKSECANVIELLSGIARKPYPKKIEKNVFSRKGGRRGKMNYEHVYRKPKLKSVLKDSKISLLELSRRIGYAPSSVSSLVHQGHRKWRIETAKIMLDYFEEIGLNYTFDELWGKEIE